MEFRPIFPSWSAVLEMTMEEIFLIRYQIWNSDVRQDPIA